MMDGNICQSVGEISSFELEKGGLNSFIYDKFF